MSARVLLLGLAVVGPVAMAAEGGHEFRIGPRIGPGEIRIDARKAISQNVVSRTVQEDTFGLGGTLEYKAPFGLVVEAGHFTQGETDWWDDDKLMMSETTASVGWQIDLGNGFSVLPRAGRSKWKVEDDESWFDDDDALNPKIRGYQNYWELSAYKRVSSAVTLGISHRENHFDFGRSRSTVFTAMFNIGETS